MNLSVSTLFFELALIFIPGFIWMKIHSRYGFKGEKTQFDLILNAFIFGVLSYTVLYFIGCSRFLVADFVVILALANMM